jgi:hypothetical protein
MKLSDQAKATLRRIKSKGFERVTYPTSAALDELKDAGMIHAVLCWTPTYGVSVK